MAAKDRRIKKLLFLGMDYKYALAVFSTFSILIPVSFCVWALFKKAEVYLWLFLFFLVFGFSVDTLSWLSYLMPERADIGRWSVRLYSFYPVIEGIFFFWLIMYFSGRGNVHNISRIGMFLVLPMWLLAETIFTDRFWAADLGLFHMFYRVICAFLAAFTLLKIVESRESVMQSPRFWHLSGVLLYAFGTFFIATIRETSLADQLWYVHNLVNVFTYIIFTAGFYFQATDHKAADIPLNR